MKKKVATKAKVKTVRANDKGIGGAVKNPPKRKK